MLFNYNNCAEHLVLLSLAQQVLYTLGGLENLQTAKKYYASTIDLTGGKNTRALFGICLVRSHVFICSYVHKCGCLGVKVKISNAHLLLMLTSKPSI